MNNSFSLIIPILFPMLCGLAVGLVPALKHEKKRRIFVLVSLAATLVLTTSQLVMSNISLHICTLAPKMDIRFRVDSVTRYFAGLIAFMWLMSGIFSFEYMKHEKNHNRYYCFFLLGEGAMLGVAFAANYVTMYLSFEWMTLLTLPMVLHSQNEEALKAGMKYLLYSFAGAFAGLLGIPFLARYGTTLDFVPGGVLDSTAIAGHEALLLGVAFTVVLGFGAKAGLFPLHAWLPTAHPVAPAPASAVLSGVITKAGVIAIFRVIYFQFGPDFLRGTWVQNALLYISLLTVFMGSSMAFREKILKRRLAYSTVSQVSYILFGLFLMNETAMTGALLHVLCHSVAKDGLFLCAGSIIYKTHKTKVDELTGIGKEMPVTIWCYTLCSLALIGIPPMCGFMSKWYLAIGSLSSDIPVISWLGPVILLISALLTAAYLLPITIRGFFPGEDFDYSSLEKKETSSWMLVPLIILAVLAAFTVFPQPFLSLVESATAALM
jgi:multicomponent Na+:H+ antiporter subunit D